MFHPLSSGQGGFDGAISTSSDSCPILLIETLPISAIFNISTWFLKLTKGAHTLLVIIDSQQHRECISGDIRDFQPNSGHPVLTPMDRQFSSPLLGNFTMNLEPAFSSLSFSGRKRHTTLILSSAGSSARSGGAADIATQFSLSKLSPPLQWEPGTSREGLCLSSIVKNGQIRRNANATPARPILKSCINR